MSIEADEQLYFIPKRALDKVSKVMKRLYTENRLVGDEYRDLAHTLQSAVSEAFEAPAADAKTWCENCRKYVELEQDPRGWPFCPECKGV
jgi:hypothetical protein